jgi:hypothetical protein
MAENRTRDRPLLLIALGCCGVFERRVGGDYPWLRAGSATALGFLADALGLAVAFTGGQNS